MTHRFTVFSAYRRPHQHGMTLIELLVAMAISLLITLAAAGVLVSARQGYRAVDATSQLRDDARFAAEMIGRLVQQAGYEDVNFAGATRASAFKVAGEVPPPPYVEGVSNALMGTTSTPLTDTVADSRSACPAAQGSGCANGSDVLILRYQGALDPSDPTKKSTDQSMITCDGNTIDEVSDVKATVTENIIYLGFSNGEPALMCRYLTWNKIKGVRQWTDGLPLVKGVENFQVLFGTDGVQPNAIPGTIPQDSLAERYLTADQIAIPGNTTETNNNWRRVRSVRIGLVIRGPQGSAPNSQPAIFYPLGKRMSADTDKGSAFTPGVDGRLRQTLSFTVNLRNAQGA